ncbi:MAG TPA: hypothetical protein VFG54_12185 [Prolixibacteraceae bacterium]|nr:hypothetical protein [Prolixibacteraceae bacterium]
MEHEKYGNHGFMRDGSAALTYEIVGASDQKSVAEDKKEYSGLAILGDHFQYQNFTVASHGPDNQLPALAISLIRNNPYLPEILKKQVKIAYGQGFGLFVDNETEDNKRQRKWVTSRFPQVMNWLDSWKQYPDMDPYEVYFKRALFEYFYMEGIYSMHLTNKSRRTGGDLPFRGLKALNGKKVRMAMNGILNPRQEIAREDLTHALVGRWEAPWAYETEVYPLFNRANPLGNAVSVNYVADLGFDEDIYAIPTSFYGLKEWIIGVNLDPKYINSFLKNSLSAKIHIKIPHAWIELKTKTLQSICAKNKELEQDAKPIITHYDGVAVGTVFAYALVEQLIQKKLTEAIGVLSGEGENQGKAFWSRTFLTEHGIESWDFVEIPTKYKEFITSILDYDKRGLAVILAGKGLDPAISNVTNEGIFNSGSEIYYNYLLYLDLQRFAEEYVCQDINTQLWINFPELARERVKGGFYRFAPERQADTSPQNRMEKQKN